MITKKGPTLKEGLPLFETLQLFIRVGSSLVIVSEFLYLELYPHPLWKGLGVLSLKGLPPNESNSLLSSVRESH